jgi:hypothetical protein
MPCWIGVITQGHRHSIISKSFLVGRPDRQNLSRPYTFNSMEEYKAGLKKVGEALKTAPQIRSPIIIGITG